VPNICPNVFWHAARAALAFNGSVWNWKMIGVIGSGGEVEYPLELKLSEINKHLYEFQHS
jgi:hypothetical protein